MYLTFEDYSKLNDWIEAYQKNHPDIIDTTVKTDNNHCIVAMNFVTNDQFTHRAELYFGTYNMFQTYNYNKFEEDMSLLIKQEIMRSEY